MRNQRNSERKFKKVKLNDLFEDDNFKKLESDNKSTNKKIDNTFVIQNIKIEKIRPVKICNVIKTPSILPSKQILIDIHSNDPLTLHNLFLILKQIKITDEIFSIVIRKCKDVIFREIKNTIPTGIIYYPGDDINIRNVTKSNINIFTKIFELITSKCYSKSMFTREISDQDIFSLFHLLKSEDERERMNICNILINIYDAYSIKIKYIVENELIQFYEDNRTHIGIEELLELLQLIIKNTKDDSFFYQVALRFLSIKNLEYYKLITDIIYKYCSEDVKISNFTLNYIFVLYEKVDYINKPILVKLYFNIYIRWAKRIPFRGILNDMCFIINFGLSSEYHPLVEEVLKTLDSRIIKKIFSEYIDDILPKIFNNIYLLSKKYWYSKGKLRIFKYISILLSMNYACFEKCLINYNLDKFVKKIFNFTEDTVLDILRKCIEHTNIENKNEWKNMRRRSSEFNGKPT